MCGLTVSTAIAQLQEMGLCISNRLYGQFEVITSMLALPFKETLDTYPTLDPIMRMVEQEDLREKEKKFL